MTTHSDLVNIVVVARPAMSNELALQSIDMFPKWENVIGVEITQDMIDRGNDRFQYKGKLYSVIQPHTPQSDWYPDITPALYLEISLEEWPEWKQPTGAHDAYDEGDKVTYQNEHYVSKINGNTTIPGSDDRYWEKV